MLVVSIELWPFGDALKAKKLGEIHIANDGAGSAETGDYTVNLMKSTEYSRKPGVWKAGKVSGFPRLRLGPYDLLYRALHACVASRNKESK